MPLDYSVLSHAFVNERNLPIRTSSIARRREIQTQRIAVNISKKDTGKNNKASSNEILNTSF